MRFCKLPLEAAAGRRRRSLFALQRQTQGPSCSSPSSGAAAVQGQSARVQAQTEGEDPPIGMDMDCTGPPGRLDAQLENHGRIHGKIALFPWP